MAKCRQSYAFELRISARPATYRNRRHSHRHLCSPILLPHLRGDAAVQAQAASASSNAGSVELEDILFVQDPHLPGGKQGIRVFWIPQPVQKYCLGKTAQQCIDIDYCLRTSNRNVATCRNLAVDITRIPPYPGGMRPRRVHSIVFFQVGQIGGSELLKNLYENGAQRFPQPLLLEHAHQGANPIHHQI